MPGQNIFSGVLDYRDKDVIPRIHELAPRLGYAFDTMGSSKTSSIVQRAYHAPHMHVHIIR